VKYIKDNRLLPDGFQKSTAPEDIAVKGNAAEDPDFRDGSDRVRYFVSVREAKKPLRIHVELWYQPIGFRWAHNLAQEDAVEIERFVSYFKDLADSSGIILAADTANIK